MKSSINLAVLAVVIVCFVHGGVAGKHRGKCVEKGRGTATQDICDYHRSMFIADSKLGSMLHSPQRLIQYIFRTFNVLYTPAVSFLDVHLLRKEFQACYVQMTRTTSEYIRIF